MALLHYTPAHHVALQDVADQKVMRTRLWDGHYAWSEGGEVMPLMDSALEDLRHSGLIAWDHTHIPGVVTVRVLLTFDGSDRLSTWDVDHREGVA
jgi:hypothetical protein